MEVVVAVGVVGLVVVVVVVLLAGAVVVDVVVVVVVLVVVAATQKRSKHFSTHATGCMCRVSIVLGRVRG